MTDVVYLGADTRYVVALEAGATLVVTQQNLLTSSMEALALRGIRVRLAWKRQHCLRVEGDETALSAEYEGT